MSDSELRKLVLKKYYDRRREGFIDLQPSDFDGMISHDDILYASGQLAQDDLIEWHAAPDHRGRAAKGVGKIALRGIKTVDGEVQTPANTVLDFSTHINGSRNVQVGTGNVQTVNSAEFVKAIENLIKAIQNSPASEEEKKGMKQMLAEFTSNPTVSALIGAAATVGFGKLLSK